MFPITTLPLRQRLKLTRPGRWLTERQIRKTRRDMITRAGQLGIMHVIPPEWNPDGRLRP